MADQTGGTGGSRSDPRKMSREDMLRTLREQGVTSLDDLVSRASEQARSGGGDVSAEAAWFFVTGKYVLAGSD